MIVTDEVRKLLRNAAIVAGATVMGCSWSGPSEYAAVHLPPADVARNADRTVDCRSICPNEHPIQRCMVTEVSGPIPDNLQSRPAQLQCEIDGGGSRVVDLSAAPPRANDPQKCARLCSEGLGIEVARITGCEGAPARDRAIREGEPFAVCWYRRRGRFRVGIGSLPSGRAPMNMIALRGDTFEHAGAYLAECAKMEAASEVAFLQLADDLSHFGAPNDLIAAAREAADDEARHAVLVGRIARGLGATVSEPTYRAPTRPSLRALAIDNAREGCVRETLGAALAHHQAAYAQEPTVRDAMAQIADEESRHAALSWALHGWLSSRAPADWRAANDALRDAAAEAILPRIEDPRDARALGMPSRAAGARLKRLVLGMRG